MQRRRVGQSGLEISPLMLGGNVFGWTADTATSFRILDAFLDHGFNAIDTADIYSSWVPGHTGGESETVIGQWIKSRGRRDRFVLATKVGAGPVTDWNRGYLSARHIESNVEASLRRLRTDYVDLYQAHRDDPETPLEETLGAFERLRASGKVREIGASHYSPERLSEALEVSAALGLPAYRSMQAQYNLVERSGFEGPLQDVCLAADLGVLCFSALAKGFLSGKHRSQADIAGTTYEAFLQPCLGERGARILHALENVAAEQSTRMAAVALAWLIAQPGVASALFAVNSPLELDEAVGALRLTLSADQLSALDAASRDTESRAWGRQ